MIKIGNGFALFIVSLLVSVSALAKINVQAVVDRNELGVGSSFTLSVVVTSEESVDVSDPRVPDLKGFELLNSWRTSGSAQRLMQTAKGMEFLIQRTDQYSYLLAAKQKGTYTINAFEVVVDGKAYSTKPIMIRVLDADTAPQRGGQKAGPRGRQNIPGFGTIPDDSIYDSLHDDDDPFTALLRRRYEEQMPAADPNEGRPEPQLRTLPKNPNEAFFIQVEVDKMEVYEGEQVTVSWYVYTRGQMESLDRLKFPDLRGFWKEIIEEVPSIQFTEEIVDGVPYRKALLASHALFPIKAGTAVVDEYKIKSRVRMPSQGFGGFSLGRPFEYTKSSQRVSIKVNPLPLDGRPKNFSGAVGQFDVNSSVENQTVPAHQPFSLKLRFEGAGNAKLIELPAIDWPPGLEVYDTKSDAKFFKNGRSYKEFEILLIPRETGEVRIPSISVSMFDPASKKYLTRNTEEIPMKVEANPNGTAAPGKVDPAGPNAAANPESRSAVPRGDVLPNLILSWDQPNPISRAMSANSAGVVGGLYGLALLMLLWKSKVELGWGRRRQNLRDIVRKRYKKLEGPLQKNEYRVVGAEMMNIFNLVLGSVSGHEASGLELERMLEKISPSLRRDHGDALRAQYEVFQIMSFAPENMLGPYKEPAKVKAEIDKAKALLGKIISSDPEQNKK